MNMAESEYVSDHQLGIDNYHDYIVEQLNRFMQQHSDSNMYEQGIDTIRPPERSGYNTPARPPRLQTPVPQPPLVNTTTTTVPPRLQTPAPQLPLVNTNVSQRSFASSPPLTHSGQPSRPSFAVDVVIGFKEISVDLRKCVKDVVKQNYNFFSKLRQVVLFLVFLGLAGKFRALMFLIVF